MFKRFNGLLSELRSVVKWSFSTLVVLLPLFELFLGQDLLSNDQCSQAFHTKVITRLFDDSSLCWSNLLLNNHFSSFKVEDDHSWLNVLHNDTHSLRVWGEGEVGKDLILFSSLRWILEHYLNFISVNQFVSKVVNELDEGHFIRWTGLEVSSTIFIIHWCDIVTHHKSSHQISNRILRVSSLLPLLVSNTFWWLSHIAERTCTSFNIFNSLILKVSCHLFS